MATRASGNRSAPARVRWGAAVGCAAALAAVACAPAPTASTVVTSVCPPDRDFVETIVSTARPARPRAGGTVRFELGVRRLQVDVGPLREGRYVFPVPAGVARVTGVDFADDNPDTWEVSGGDLLVRFVGPDGGWLVNDFPRFTIVAELSPSLRPGAVIAWRPYRRFEQQFVNMDRPLACTIADPGQILQSVVVG
jgi:hypothetical protein